MQYVSVRKMEELEVKKKEEQDLKLGWPHTTLHS